MPHQPYWFPRLREIQERLKQAQTELLDRAMVQELFDTSKMQACRLIKQWGGFRLGGAWMIARQALLETLAEIQQGETYLREARRRRKVEDRIAETRRLLRARQTVIVPAGGAEEVRSQRLEALPEGIELEAGELRIRFHSTEELLEKLARLAYAFLNLQVTRE